MLRNYDARKMTPNQLRALADKKEKLIALGGQCCYAQYLGDASESKIFEQLKTSDLQRCVIVQREHVSVFMGKYYGAGAFIQVNEEGLEKLKQLKKWKILPVKQEGHIQVVNF